MTKLVAKMKRGPRNNRFDERDRCLPSQGFTAVPRGGSHPVDRRDDGATVTVVRPHGGAQTVHIAAVKQVPTISEAVE